MDVCVLSYNSSSSTAVEGVLGIELNVQYILIPSRMKGIKLNGNHLATLQSSFLSAPIVQPPPWMSFASNALKETSIREVLDHYYYIISDWIFF